MSLRFLCGNFWSRLYSASLRVTVEQKKKKEERKKELGQNEEEQVATTIIT